MRGESVSAMPFGLWRARQRRAPDQRQQHHAKPRNQPEPGPGRGRPPGHALPSGATGRVCAAARPRGPAPARPMRTGHGSARQARHRRSGLAWRHPCWAARLNCGRGLRGERAISRRRGFVLDPCAPGPAPRQPCFAKPDPAFVIVTAPQCALRDLRQPLRQPLPLAVLAAVALVLALSGPFGTLEALRPGPRLAYWAAVVALTWAAGHMGSAPLRHALTGRSLATPAAPAETAAQA